ncbi:MAG TPA: ATP-binding protein [Aeromicrobium sp.]|nr:ATP-binding protein [Aeromicrobium sp.]
MTADPAGRLSRLPLRVRLVTGFSAATLLALVAAGAFVYWRVEYALDRGLDTELRHADATIVGLIEPSGSLGDRSEADATGVGWQLLDAHGAVLDHGGPAGSHPHVTRHWLTASRAPSRTYNAGDLLPASPRPYRLRVSRIARGPARYVLVAVRRDHRDEALRELLVQLAVAGVAMLIFTAFVGERLARAALRPVEEYRRQAAAIAEGAADLRLDVPSERDDEVTRLGHTFNEMLASLERALARERAFVNEASHELRTPITLLTSRIQLARRRPRSEADHEEILDELQVDLNRLARLAESLLQLGAAGERSTAENSDVTQVARRVLATRVAAEPAGDIAVELALDPMPVPLADVDVERILTNLVDNAISHGAPPITVSTDVPADGWVRLTVSDQGEGMPPQLLETASRRFTRADAARTRPGAGLGLALVETVVARAGGSLRLCHGEHHWTDGRLESIGCAHGDAMTVTVILPTADSGPEELRQHG